MNHYLRRTTTWVIAALSAAVLVLLVVVITMAGSSGRDDIKPRRHGSGAHEEATAGKPWPKVEKELPAEAVSGSIKVKVNSTSRAASISDGGETYKPVGEYIIADVTVTNVGKEPWISADTEQEFELIGPDGTAYAHDWSLMSINMDTGYIDMNPGHSVRIRIPFDVPKGAQVEAMAVFDAENPTAAPAEVKVP